MARQTIESLELAFWNAKRQAEQAELQLTEAKDQLIRNLGLESGKLDLDQFSCFEKVNQDRSMTKVCLFAKSRASWDNDLLMALAVKCPEILEAKKESYWSEVRLTKKNV